MDYISSPHLLLEENQVQKIKSSFMGLIYKFLGRQQKMVYSFVMEREKELYNVGKYFVIYQMLVEQKEEIFDYIKDGYKFNG